MVESQNKLDTFISEWEDGGTGNKEAFLTLRLVLESLELITVEFIPREGLTYSLRAKHKHQQKKQLFVMVDVIEGDPRWLSICFYAEMITDPDEKADFVPGGLLGEDAFCFDMEEYSSEMVGYFEARIHEAYKNAANT